RAVAGSGTAKNRDPAVRSGRSTNLDELGRVGRSAGLADGRRARAIGSVLISADNELSGIDDDALGLGAPTVDACARHQSGTAFAITTLNHKIPIGQEIDGLTAIGTGHTDG